MIFALYDENDRPLGSFTRDELEQLLNTNKRSFYCIISRLLKKQRNGIYYKGTKYHVFVYREKKYEI